MRDVVRGPLILRLNRLSCFSWS